MPCVGMKGMSTGMMDTDKEFWITQIKKQEEQQCVGMIWNVNGLRVPGEPRRTEEEDERHRNN